jgi:hypothetical protein
MNQTASKQIRILAIASTARGFGYSVMEGDVLLECGSKGVKGNKNLHSISKIEKLMKQFLPSVLVLQNVNAPDCRRAPRIKTLHKQVIGLATNQKCRIALISGKKLRITLLGDVKATKHEIAQSLALKFPVELAEKLPPKRRPWENEDGRMDTFDAVGLAMVFLMRKI